MIIKRADVKQLLDGRCGQPHAFLGMHSLRKGKQSGLVVRALLDSVISCEVVDTGASAKAISYPMERIDEAGFFEVWIPGRDFFKYQLRARRENGEIRQFSDPYSFLPTLGEQDIYFFNEGTETRVYEKLGAHLRTIDGVPGVAFAVWAPNASRVSVVGDFNHWNGRFHPMRSLGMSGLWELFIPGLEPGIKYKYEIARADGGYPHLKTDPYGTAFESPPHNAAIIADTRAYEWGDSEWVQRRGSMDWNQRPISVYEVHLGSWKRVVEDNLRPLTYREIAHQLVDYVTDMGFTHVEFMPLSEYPFEGSWGYQVTGFFAPTHRHGTPEDFMYLVDTLHQAGIGVIMDWVPAHFPTDSFALAQFDGSHLYEHADPRQGFHQDWGTLIFNYGRDEVRSFLIGSALAWFDRYHIDGLRVDAVASMLYLDYSREEGQWIPNRYGGRENLEAISFIKETNRLAHQLFPGTLMIAEESTAFPGVTTAVEDGGLGFDLKWNMGWMHDTLKYFEKDPIYRRYEHWQLTFGMLYQYSERFTQVFSHDEVVHGKGSMINKMGAGSIAEKARHLRLLYTFMWLWPGKKTLFMGSEFGQSAEWNHAKSLDWHLLEYTDHSGTQRVVRDLNHLYRDEPVLFEHDFDHRNFQWLNGDDAEQSVLSFARLHPNGKDCLLVVLNLTPVPRPNYRLGVPHAGRYEPIFNSDAAVYGGSEYAGVDMLESESVPSNGRDQSVVLQIPPLAGVVYRYQLASAD
jgi:1,4-alpha-glucan branching enzyme